MTAEQNLLYYGTELASDGGQPFCAGLLSLDFIDGGLCNIRYAGHEVLRAINYVVRDKDWGTYAPSMRNLHITQQASAFSIAYEASCRDPNGQLLDYAVRIVGTAAGALQFDARSTAATDFLTCRNGFCVLHPINGVAGQAVMVEHTDGSTEVSVFPELIEPWQPFKEIQAITHQVTAGLQATCRFSGDVFEMEDQRNWSDASYKTYVRPLARPWPYLMAQGDGGAQSISLQIQELAGQPCKRLAPIRHTVITLRPSNARLPKIGIAIAPEEIESSLRHIDHVRALGAQIILCHFDPASGHGTKALSGFAAIAGQTGGQAILECVLPGSSDPAIELAAIAAQLAASGFKPDGVAVCPSVDRQSVPPGSAWPPCPPLEQIYQAARHAFPNLRLGGGMFSYFTEFNRKRPPCAQLDWVTHATNPIVHAADDLSVMQTLEALPHITRSCRAIVGADKPYWIGPVTLGMRQNPYGSRTMPNPDQQRMPMASSDPRQRGLFGAAWLIGYAAQIASADLEVLTLGGVVGPRGVLGHPAFHVVAGLAKLAGATRIECHSSQPDKVLAIAATDRLGQASMWIANLSASPQPCRIDGAIPAGQPMVSVLDEHHHLAMGLRSDPSPSQDDLLELLPYSCLHYVWP